VGSGGKNYRLLYIRFAGNVINWTYNVVANTNHKRGFSNQAKTNVPTFRNNFYFNTVNLLSLAEGNEEAITFFDNDEFGGNGTDIATDPFKDAANYDFTIVNEKISDKGAGDPRWLVAQ
jgi:hypothetical protein